MAGRKLVIHLEDTNDAHARLTSDLVEKSGYRYVRAASLAHLIRTLQITNFKMIEYLILDIKLPDGLLHEIMPYLQQLGLLSKSIILSKYKDHIATIVQQYPVRAYFWKGDVNLYTLGLRKLLSPKPRSKPLPLKVVTSTVFYIFNLGFLDILSNYVYTEDVRFFDKVMQNYWSLNLASGVVGVAPLAVGKSTCTPEEILAKINNAFRAHRVNLYLELSGRLIRFIKVSDL